jgi:hypothetical protein
MMGKCVRLALLLATVAVVASGCRGCMRENVVYEHVFNRPDCGPKPCPVECGEFELPPGGPYLTTPSGPPPPPSRGAAPATISIK